MRHPIFLVFLLLVAADVRAQQDDLRRVLEQGSELRHQQQDQQRLQQAESQRPTLTIDGQTVRVERTVDDLGQALYLSLQHQRWPAAAAFWPNTSSFRARSAAAPLRAGCVGPRGR